MLFHKLNSSQFRAGFQVVDAETGCAAGGGALVKSEGGRVSALGEAGGAGVQAVDPVHVGFGGENVGVPREIGVGFVVAEQVGVVEVAVAQEEFQAAFLEFGVVREARESEHHLVHLGVAVPADGGNFLLERAQEFDNSLRVVSAGERVPRPVIKKVAQKENAVAFELVEVRKSHLAGESRTVYIRKN